MKEIKEIREIAAQYDARALEHGPIVIDQDDDEVVVKMTKQDFRLFQETLAQGRRAKSEVAQADASNDEAFAQTELAALAPEIEAYKKMLPELLKTYKGRWVALHGGQVVDTGDQWGELAMRVTQNFPDPIYIELVSEDSPRQFEIPSVFEAQRVSL